MSLLSPSPLATRALLLARLVVKADERSSGSIEGKADAAGLLLWPTSEPHCATAACGLLLCPICMHRVHHIQGGADDVTGLLTAALTA